MQSTYRVWNDKNSEYRWIHLAGSVKTREDGEKLLYGVYSDVSGQIRLENELRDANEKMQDIVNAIPGGVAIYRVTDIFETVYFSDGVPELSGYTVEEYRELAKQDASGMIYRDDLDMVVSQALHVIQSHEIAKFEFRKQHRAGHVVWVRAQVKWIGEDDGWPLLHCVFHNVTDLKDAQLEMDHLVNSIPGGIASYRVEGERFIPTFYSDGVLALSGHSREEFQELIRENALDIIYEQDRERVLAAAKTAILSGKVLDVSYRMRHKDGSLIWVHLNGRRMGPLSEKTRFYAVFTGMSAESRLFQGIANEAADGIYVIDRENYDLLYVNESKSLFLKNENCLGKKCYEALQKKDEPCEFCSLLRHRPDGEEHEMSVPGSNRFYVTRFHETDWNGVPAYIKFVRDVTEEVTTRREMERLEQYFQTLVKNLPGGVAVVCRNRDGSMKPEYLSDGFAAMTGMTLPEAWELYQGDAMAGVHPEDRQTVDEKMCAYIASGGSHCEIVYRLRRGDGGYIWVKNTLSLIQNEGGESRVYAVYHDMTEERKEQARLRQQYNELIIQHYRRPGPDALIVAHSNITQNRVLETTDYTDSYLVRSLGTVRKRFFDGLAALIVDPDERNAFLSIFQNTPALAAFQRGETEQNLQCFIKLPREQKGRCAKFKLNLVATPDSGDVTGILTVSDITEQSISDRILHQLSVSSSDLVVDVDLLEDRYAVLTGNGSSRDIPEPRGRHSDRIRYMLENQVVPRDRKRVSQMLDRQYMLDRLKREGAYSFSYSINGEEGDILTKNLNITAIDLRLGRVCMVRTDITDSVREQQGLLNMIAYTFELACFIEVSGGQLTMYTRQTVLDNLPPYTMEDYNKSVRHLVDYYEVEDEREQVENQFRLADMLRRLQERPSGYDFVFSCRVEGERRYKQINVLWGDENHRTICLVRADVTDMLAAERETKEALEHALALAREANRAKSDFLSAMSHDIRTPMNAIMGMTELAKAHLSEPERLADCLQKISISSRHLLGLINDVLDMSRIERSQITLNRRRIFLPELLEQLSAMVAPQAASAGLRLDIRMGGVPHPYFYGDHLRINQILINILSNAVKFTPKGGSISVLAEEIPPVQDPLRTRCCFTVSDTGVGMTEEFLTHIFEPFTRSPSSAQIEGTGLGLSITKGLVDQMNGTIAVKSQIGEGTTFQVELELEIAEPGGEGEVQALSRLSEKKKQEALSGKFFLVAEDNEINSEILCELLSWYGAESDVKTDGIQAVEAFRSTSPGTYDAVLMDIQMPGMNGYEAARAIRRMDRPDAERIPIIAMTANAFAEDVQASREAGMNAHVSKPIDVEELYEKLSRALRG